MLPSIEQLIDLEVQVKRASAVLLHRLLLSIIIVVITAIAMLSLVLEVA